MTAAMSSLSASLNGTRIFPLQSLNKCLTDLHDYVSYLTPSHTTDPAIPSFLDILYRDASKCHSYSVIILCQDLVVLLCILYCIVLRNLYSAAHGSGQSLKV